MQGVRLLNEDFIVKWLPKDNPGIASKLMKLGVRSFLHKVAGYEHQKVEQPKSAIELLEMHLQIAKAHEQRLLAIEAENKMLREQLEIVEMETTANTAELERFRNGHGQWFSVAGWCSLKGIKDKSLKELNMLGRKASALCRQRNIIPQKTTDPRFGLVGVYPDSILMELI